MNTRPAAPGDGIPAGTRIIARPPGHPDAASLLEELFREQTARYGFADPPGLNPAEFTPPHGAFAVAYHHGVPAGCGGYRQHDPGTVEIKKTYVTPARRGTGTGRALLAWLERHAAAAGARRAILETGVRNTAARRLFTAAGYKPVPGYVPGRDPAINRAYARDLTRPA